MNNNSESTNYNNLQRQANQKSYEYKIGGGLTPNHPTYVKRTADKELYENLMRGEFCYVFNSRQMGKSSLQNRVKQELENKGIKCLVIPISAISSEEITSENWYAGIVDKLITKFALDINLTTWWQEQKEILAPDRLSKFIETQLLAGVSEKIVIFLDEIDSVRGLPFQTYDFFRLIKACHENRGQQKPEYDRLTFVLIGVATPTDLVKDDNYTFFNFGKAIELEGIKPDEGYPLIEGLEAKTDEPKVVLEEILKLTGGQPFLTQKICQMICDREERITTGQEAESLTAIVEDKIIKDWEAQDEPEHLKTLRDRILRSEENPRRLLSLYKKILKEGKIQVDDDDLAQVKLRLSGLVVKKGAYLEVFNPIYKQVFDEAWVDKYLARLDNRNLKLSCVSGCLVTLLLVAARLLGLIQPFELWAFDNFMRMRPLEKPDSRIVVVEVTDEDLEKYADPEVEKEYPKTISDRTVVQLLEKLNSQEKYRPRAIGLDIFRDVPLGKGNTDLRNYLLKSDRIISICKGIPINNNDPYLPADNRLKSDQLGVADLKKDEFDRVIRRQFLGLAAENSPCKTQNSLSYSLAVKFLAPENIKPKPISGGGWGWRIGQQDFKLLESYTGSYQQIGDGFQIFLNYRNFKQEQPFLIITLSQILQEDFNLSLINDKVVIIGYTANSKKVDFHQTPYGTMRGVLIHAHMLSQILSAAKGERHILQALPWWGDTLLILIFSVTGGLVGIFLTQKSMQLAGCNIVIFFSIGGIYYITLSVFGVWLPFVPSILAFLIASNTIEKIKYILEKSDTLHKFKILFLTSTDDIHRKLLQLPVIKTIL
jgi:CHASE2 domain-containing sensor protein